MKLVKILTVDDTMVWFNPGDLGYVEEYVPHPEEPSQYLVGVRVGEDGHIKEYRAVSIKFPDFNSETNRIGEDVAF